MGSNIGKNHMKYGMWAITSFTVLYCNKVLSVLCVLHHTNIVCITSY